MGVAFASSPEKPKKAHDTASMIFKKNGTTKAPAGQGTKAPAHVAQRANPSPNAGSISFSGDTTGGSTFQRPEDDCSAGSTPGVPYSSQHFTVSVSGNYTITSEQDYDGFIVLYSPSFNGANPTTNCVTGNDDDGDIGLSGIHDVPLTAGTDYVIVTTGYADDEFGPFTNTISGPGIVNGVGLALNKEVGAGGVPNGGGNMTFTFTALNGGANAESGVTVTDVLPAGLTYVSDTCGGSSAGGTWTWNIGALAPAATATCTLTVSVAGPGCPSVTNEATITATSGATAGGLATNGGEAVNDGSFETGLDGTAWEQDGTTASPLCNAGCSGGFNLARSGAWWAWFGGWDDHVEVGSLTQSITVPSGGASTISFYVWMETCNAAQGANDFVRLTIDGTEVWREDATSANCGEDDYHAVSVTLPAGVANGAAHVFKFESTQNGDGAYSNFFLDDVSIATNVCTTATDHIFSDGFDPPAP